jgi:hypothetical protein
VCPPQASTRAFERAATSAPRSTPRGIGASPGRRGRGAIIGGARHPNAHAAALSSSADDRSPLVNLNDKYRGRSPSPSFAVPSFRDMFSAEKKHGAPTKRDDADEEFDGRDGRDEPAARRRLGMTPDRDRDRRELGGRENRGAGGAGGSLNAKTKILNAKMNSRDHRGHGGAAHLLPDSLTSSRGGSLDDLVHALGAVAASRHGSLHGGSRPESLDGGDRDRADGGGGDGGGGGGATTTTTTAAADAAVAAAASNAAAGVQSEFRERLWSYLLGNVVRAVDEVYFLCELECGGEEIDAAVRLLEESAEDFNALKERLTEQEMFAADPESRAISWDVGRTDVRPSARHYEMIQEITGRSDGGRTPDPGEREGGGGGDDEDGGGGEWTTAGARGRAGKNANGSHGKAAAAAAANAAGPRAMSKKERKKARAAEHNAHRSSSNVAPNRSSSDSDLEKSAAIASSKTSAGAATTKASAAASAAASGAAAKPPGKPPLPRSPSSPAELPARTNANATPPRVSAAKANASWADESDDLPPVMADASFDGGDEKEEEAANAKMEKKDLKKDLKDEDAPPPAAAWGEKRNWGNILDPTGAQAALAARLINRGKSPAELHLKLMSPDRNKKKTPMETAAAMRERHERAKDLRRRVETERAARRKFTAPTPREREEEEERRIALRALELEARHRRAEETREERISAVVRKASEETRKVEEIAFYNSLEVENKKAALRDKLTSAELRRAAQAEERRRAAEAAETAARAAEERRAAEQAAKRSTLEEKVREKELRREREAAEREAAATAHEERRAREAEDKERSRVAREREAKKRAEERLDEMRRRLFAAERRRREYLDVVRERAVIGSAGKDSTLRPATSPPASPARGGGGSGAMMSPGRGGGGGAPESPSRVRGGGGAGESGGGFPGGMEREMARAAAAAERHKAMRKRAKKLRQRLANAAGPLRWPTDAERENAAAATAEDETSSVAAAAAAAAAADDDVGYAPLPPATDAARPRLERVALAISKRKPESLSHAHRDVMQALAEAGGDAARAGGGENASGGSGSGSARAAGAAAASAALAAAVTSGLVRALAEALAESLNSSATGGGFAASPAAAAQCVSLARALDAATAASATACEHLLAENLASPLVPHLVAGLGWLGDPANAEYATPGTGGGIPPPTSALEPMMAVVARVVRGPKGVSVGGVGVGGGGGGGSSSSFEDVLSPRSLARASPTNAAEDVAAAAVSSSAASHDGGVEAIGCEAAAAREKITAPARASASARAQCARVVAMSADFVELLVTSGAVDAIASLFALHDRPKATVEPVPPGILAGLRLLEALLDARAPAPGRELVGGVDRYNVAVEPETINLREGESPAGSLIAALKETALGGLPSLLTSVLLQTEATLRTPVLQDPAAAARELPSNFVPVAAAAVRLLNATARFGPEIAQDALSSPDLRVETHHLLSFILALCASEWDSAVAAKARADRERKNNPGGGAGDKNDDASEYGVAKDGRRARHGGSDNAGATVEELAELLDQTVLFIGAFALLSPSNQDMLCWGRAPTLMQRLPDLPFEYYSDSRKIAVLFPTLVAVAFGHGTNRALISNELSLETVRGFAAREIDARASGASSSAAAEGLCPAFGFAARFPPALWQDAVEYFGPDGG